MGRNDTVEEDMKNFIVSCVNLGKELVNKDRLSEKEEKFLENLEVIIEKYFS
jgi:hypothetical protein